MEPRQPGPAQGDGGDGTVPESRQVPEEAAEGEVTPGDGQDGRDGQDGAATGSPGQPHRALEPLSVRNTGSGKSGGESGKSGGESGKSGGESGKAGGESGKVQEESGKEGEESGKAGGESGKVREESEKAGEGSGKSGEESGKEGEESGKAREGSGKAGEESGKSGEGSRKVGEESGGARESGKSGEESRKVGEESGGARESPAPAPSEPKGPSPSREPQPDFHCVKWITWKGERTPVITQSGNGPCPLLAIMNTLLLRWKVKLPPQKEVVTSDELMAHLGDCILSIQPQEQSEGLRLNFQQNVHDTMTVLPKLATGLDVNVRFTGVSDFEYTPECIVFDLLDVPLYHGWLVDPQSRDVAQAVGKLSYNQLVEKIITCKHSGDSRLVTEGLVAEQFLEATASQLTYHGLCELTAAAREGELSVFFRNNHFSTMTKHQGHLYLLVTDQGFLREEAVVWESLHTVDGDSCFCDTHFHLRPAPRRPRGDQDYAVALSLQQEPPAALSDLELARQLQHEEYQQQQRPAPAQGRAAPGARAHAERRQRPRADTDCVLL